jgi:hypothetical protein
LSTYPVYATARPRQATFVTAYGVTSDGLEHRLSMDVIARTDDPLIAASRTADAVAAGESDELCADIARRAPADYVAVIVVREEHDVVDAARGDDSILGRDDLANCRVSS